MRMFGGNRIGKTGKRRTITVPRFLAELLAEHIDRYPSADGWLFTAAEGGPIHHHNMRRRHFKAAAVKVGLGAIVKDEQGRKRYEGVRFHDLRHTCAALLIKAGRHLEEVKQYLGHSSIRVTSDRYAHLFPEARAAMADALDALYREAPAAPPRPELENTRSGREAAAPEKAADLRTLLERTTGFEPATPTLARLCSTS
jgi:integrase